MKNFLACVDVGFFKYAPPSLQHLAINHMAGMLGGEMSFSIGEDSISLASQSTMMAKIEERPDIDGFIFFTLRQFFYGSNLNIKGLNFVLDNHYEVHFARENISICSKEDLDRHFPMIYSTYYLLEQGGMEDSRWPAWNHVS